MQEKNKHLLEYIIKVKALQFGNFQLKSGRKSPYFFNSAMLNTGTILSLIADIYSDIIINNKLKPDCLFGSAYKGIPIVAACAMAMQKKSYGINFAFDRKEAKTHGDKGNIVGTLSGRVVIVDDVITSGISIYNAIKLIQQVKETKLVGVIIALNRQEKNENNSSTIKKHRR